MFSPRVKALLRMESDLSDPERRELALARGKYEPPALTAEQVPKARQLLRALADAANWKPEVLVNVRQAARVRELLFSDDELEKFLDYCDFQGWLCNECVHFWLHEGPEYGLNTGGLWAARKVRGGGSWDSPCGDPEAAARLGRVLG